MTEAETIIHKLAEVLRRVERPVRTEDLQQPEPKPAPSESTERPTPSAAA